MPGLYLVATPIGNLRDITLRALDLLRDANIIACEDTRVTRKLLGAYNLSTPTISYHEHNAPQVRPKLIQRLKSGEVVALVSDAGTPLISDPGYRLLKAAVAENLPVTALPGPSAALTALTLSGQPSNRFFFAGFLPVKAVARRRALGELADVPATVIFFESARRLPKMLNDLCQVMGSDREAAVARELTKRFEEIRRDRLDRLAEAYRAAGPPRGEVVVILGPPVDGRREISAAQLDDDLRAVLQDHSLRDAVAVVAAATGRPRREIYARAIQLARDRSDSGEFHDEA